MVALWRHRSTMDEPRKTYHAPPKRRGSIMVLSWCLRGGSAMAAWWLRGTYLVGAWCLCHGSVLLSRLVRGSSVVGPWCRRASAVLPSGTMVRPWRLCCVSKGYVRLFRRNSVVLPCYLHADTIVLPWMIIWLPHPPMVLPWQLLAGHHASKVAAHPLKENYVLSTYSGPTDTQLGRHTAKKKKKNGNKSNN